MNDVEIRCDCSRRTLLAMAGVDADGEPFIHVKAHKQKQLITEAVVTEGTVRIRCRSCRRWHRVTIRVADWDSMLDPLPEKISLQ